MSESPSHSPSSRARFATRKLMEGGILSVKMGHSNMQMAACMGRAHTQRASKMRAETKDAEPGWAHLLPGPQLQAQICSEVFWKHGSAPKHAEAKISASRSKTTFLGVKALIQQAHKDPGKAWTEKARRGRPTR